MGKFMELAILSFFNLVVPSAGSRGPVEPTSCHRMLTISNNTEVYDLIESGDKPLCNYEFKANSNMQLKLNFTETDLVATDYFLDYVLVFDGADCLAVRIGVAYKQSNPVFISTGNRMSALFIKSSLRGSFKSTYSAVSGQNASTPTAPFPDNRILKKCGEEVTGRRGNVSFKGDGTRNALCIWRFSVERGKRVHLQLTKLQLIYFGSWIRVLDGGDCAAPELVFKQNSQISLPYNVNSTYNELILLFASGYGSSSEIIEATYTDGESTDVSPTTPKTTTTTEFPGSSITEIPDYVKSFATRHTFNVLTAVFVHSVYYFYWITVA